MASAACARRPPARCCSGQVGSLRTAVFRGVIGGVPVMLLRPSEWDACNLFRGGRIYGGSYNEMESYLYFCRCVGRAAPRLLVRVLLHGAGVWGACSYNRWRATFTFAGAWGVPVCAVRVLGTCRMPACHGLCCMAFEVLG